MKQFIWEHLWFFMAITCALVVAICFAIQGNWWAACWAMFSASYAGLYLRERLLLERIEKEFGEYVAKVKGTK